LLQARGISALPLNEQCPAGMCIRWGERVLLSRTYWRAILLLGCLFSGGVAQAGESDGMLLVGVRQAPPFVMRDGQGAYSGITVELWQRIAAELALDYRFEDRDLQGLLAGLRDGSLDAAVAALTVTADRERVMDFSHAFHSSGLGIAVPHAAGGGLEMLKALFSWRFIQALAGLVLLLMAVGAGIWLLERRANPGQFGGPAHQGVGSGFWWSAVTMTTVGYGDKAPVTAAGRLLAIVWMFFSVITISGFTAAIASVFTVQQLGSGIAGPDDLKGVVSGTLGGSTSDEYLRGRGFRTRYYATPGEALRALSGRRVDAVVYDEPILRYLANGRFSGEVDVLPGSFQRQDYAIGLPAGSELREPINRILLEVLADPAWQQILNRYLGGR
jgi:ABC-type amino acid transport substrate-binding protein